MDLGKTNCSDTASEMSSDSDVAQYFRGPGRFLKIIPEFGVFYESLASYIITRFHCNPCPRKYCPDNQFAYGRLNFPMFNPSCQSVRSSQTVVRVSF